MNLSSEKSSELTAIEEATPCSEKSHWMQEMEIEMKSLQENGLWEPVQLPRGRKTLRN